MQNFEDLEKGFISNFVNDLFKEKGNKGFSSAELAIKREVRWLESVNKEITPMAEVLYREEDDILPFSTLNTIIEAYIGNDIYKKTGVPLDQFLKYSKYEVFYLLDKVVKQHNEDAMQLEKQNKKALQGVEKDDKL